MFLLLPLNHFVRIVFVQLNFINSFTAPIGLMTVQLTAQIMDYVIPMAHVTATVVGLGKSVTERCVLETVLGMENAIWKIPSVSVANPILVCTCIHALCAPHTVATAVLL